jgi:UDP-glucuronate decarboxylase
MKYTFSNICQPVNLGNNREFKIIEVVDCLKKLFPSKKIKVQHHPMPVDDPAQRKPKLNKAMELLQWQPKISLEEGLPKMIDWLKLELNIT